MIPKCGVFDYILRFIFQDLYIRIVYEMLIALLTSYMKRDSLKTWDWAPLLVVLSNRLVENIQRCVPMCVN